MITRIERPALPREDLEALGRALSRLQLDNGVAVIHMGEINREDVIPQMAEFCLHIEGVEWGVVSGLVKDRVVISVRNVGYVKSAGDIMKRLYDDIGSAGGHRAMAKAVVPLDRFKERYGEVSEKVIREAIVPMIVDRRSDRAGRCAKRSLGELEWWRWVTRLPPLRYSSTPLLRSPFFRSPIDKRTRAAIGSTRLKNWFGRALWNASISEQKIDARAQARLEITIFLARIIFARGCFTSSRVTTRRCIFIRTRRRFWWSRENVRLKISRAASGWRKR